MRTFPVTTSPSLDQFLNTAEREFAFLVSEFEFVQQLDPHGFPNPFSLQYRSSVLAVEVEGIQWGFGVQITLTRVSPPPGSVMTPLWAIVELRAPQELRPISGQLAELAHDASLLRNYAADILRGDFSIFPSAMRVVERHAAESAQPTKRKLP